MERYRYLKHVMVFLIGCWQGLCCAPPLFCHTQSINPSITTNVSAKLVLFSGNVSAVACAYRNKPAFVIIRNSAETAQRIYISSNYCDNKQ